MGWFDAEEKALKGRRARCRTAALPISHRLNDENKLMGFRLQDSTTDQLASIHYLRNHYQEATIYC